MRFKIALSASPVNYINDFTCSSFELAIQIFYQFCAQQLNVDKSEYDLILIDDDGKPVFTVASYGDFLRYITNLIKVAGGI